MLPEEIRQKRIALNLTQEELAKIFGVERNTIARWERGAIVPQAIGMMQLAFQSLEIGKGLNDSKIETLRTEQIEKLGKMRVRHSKNKDEFSKVSKS